MLDYNAGNEKELTGPLLTVREVARLLHVHSNTARRWADAGLIRVYRVSTRGDRRFSMADIEKFLEKMNTGSARNR